MIKTCLMHDACFHMKKTPLQHRAVPHSRKVLACGILGFFLFLHSLARQRVWKISHHSYSNQTLWEPLCDLSPCLLRLDSIYRNGGASFGPRWKQDQHLGELPDNFLHRWIFVADFPPVFFSTPPSTTSLIISHHRLTQSISERCGFKSQPGPES